jgi:hypothetical protein
VPAPDDAMRERASADTPPPGRRGLVCSGTICVRLLVSTGVGAAAALRRGALCIVVSPSSSSPYASSPPASSSSESESTTRRAAPAAARRGGAASSLFRAALLRGAGMAARLRASAARTGAAGGPPLGAVLRSGWRDEAGVGVARAPASLRRGRASTSGESKSLCPRPEDRRRADEAVGMRARAPGEMEQR